MTLPPDGWGSSMKIGTVSDSGSESHTGIGKYSTIGTLAVPSAKWMWVAPYAWGMTVNPAA